MPVKVQMIFHTIWNYVMLPMKTVYLLCIWQVLFVHRGQRKWGKQDFERMQRKKKEQTTVYGMWLYCFHGN